MIGYPYSDSAVILQSFFETAPLYLGVVELLDDDLRHLTANPATARYWNMTVEQMKGRLVSEIFSRPVVDFLLPYYREAARDRKTVSFEQQHPTPAGTIYFNVIVSFVSQPEGSAPILSYIVQDITEKRTIEAQLVASKVELEERVKSRTLELELQRAKMETVFQTVADGILVFDREGKIVFINEAMLRMARVKGINLRFERLQDFESQFLFLTDDDILIGHDQRPVQNILEGQAVKELKLRSKNVAYAWTCNFSASPVFDENGQAIMAVCTVHDVTEQSLFQQSLKRSLRDEQNHHRALEKALMARDEFVSIASHELKTPLTSLKLQTQMTKRYLEMEALDAEKVFKYFEQTETQLKRITLLVDDMLDISRISTGKLSMHPDTADLVAIIHEVVERLAGVFKLAGCEVVLDLPARCPGRWDPFRIEQVIINLLTNAVKFGRGQPIHVKLQRDSEFVVVSIKDFGRGIAPEDQDRIFERFERAISNKEVSGLGLGLYISKQIVTMHGGSIEVVSKLNEGATFVIKLPLEMKG